MERVGPFSIQPSALMKDQEEEEERYIGGGIKKVSAKNVFWDAVYICCAMRTISHLPLRIHPQICSPAF